MSGFKFLYVKQLVGRLFSTTRIKDESNRFRLG